VDAHETTDAELLAAAGRGDRPAFAVFVERHARVLWRFLRPWLGAEADAEDALQQTFLAAWRGAASARVADGARPWLFAIARHEAGRLGRLRRRRREHEDSLERLGEAAGFACETLTPERAAEAVEERARLEQALASLDPEDREVLVLRDVEGWTGPEAAEVLAISLAAEKSRLHRARLRLAAALRPAPTPAHRAPPRGDPA